MVLSLALMQINAYISQIHANIMATEDWQINSISFSFLLIERIIYEDVTVVLHHYIENRVIQH